MMYDVPPPKKKSNAFESGPKYLITWLHQRCELCWQGLNRTWRKHPELIFLVPSIVQMLEGCSPVGWHASAVWLGICTQWGLKEAMEEGQVFPSCFVSCKVAPMASVALVLPMLWHAPNFRERAFSPEPLLTLPHPLLMVTSCIDNCWCATNLLCNITAIWWKLHCKTHSLVKMGSDVLLRIWTQATFLMVLCL